MCIRDSLYTYKPLNESDKIDRKAFSGNVYELGRRYALTAPDTTADFLLPVNLERELDGTPAKGYAPQDTIRMKVQGGGENYVHGGISLQELVVPVIAFKNLRTSNKNYVEVKNAELKLLSESRKISNLIFSLEFHQRQPVGDKIQPCTYSIYMTDDEGVVISDRQTVIADKTSDNAADRVFRVRFNLKAGTYDKKNVYQMCIRDSIIPICDDEYFDDDITGRFVEFVRKVYGDDTLEENLKFVADALGGKGTPREVIRSYFLNDFYADHLKTYQKRPIYWLFDSGKQNGFKALIYLHRYTPDTIGNLRVDYLHKMQRVYESEINRMQDMIDNSTNAREIAASTKRKEKLQKQLKECRNYDEMIAHLALSRIELDLDDGVKVNYEKIQTASDGKKYAVLAKI